MSRPQYGTSLLRPSRNLSSASSIYFFFWLFCLALPLQRGLSLSLSDLFSLRPAARPMVLDLVQYSRMSDHAAKICAAQLPKFFRHPTGMTFNMQLQEHLRRIAVKIGMDNYSRLNKFWEVQRFAPWSMRRFADQLLTKYFTNMAGLEASNCQYVRQHYLKILHSAALRFQNVSVSYNASIHGGELKIVGPWRRLDPEIAFHVTTIWMRGSIFSSVAASATLYVIILLRTPIITRAFSYPSLHGAMPTGA
ncbi:GP2 protein [RtClan arterivirus]|uniref:GP2 protein n=1 Tax=RtClan arterivirus TaxID=2847271 RepID=A0A2H4MZT4_9NIDO|nr:GP2 protein [Rodent arterivirus]ATP66645.1 GP2 protein [RtClan arterivirus]